MKETGLKKKMAPKKTEQRVKIKICPKKKPINQTTTTKKTYPWWLNLLDQTNPEFHFTHSSSNGVAQQIPSVV